MPTGAWKPDGIDVLDIVSRLGYQGIQLGPPGYLGTGEQLRERLVERNLLLADAFVPFHFSREHVFREERADVSQLVELLTAASPPGARPVVVLSEGFR